MAKNGKEFVELVLRMYKIYLQLESEDVNRMVCRRMEREQGHKDATEELAEELSDGEKVESYTQKLTRNFSDLDQAPSETHQKKKSLYLVLIR